MLKSDGGHVKTGVAGEHPNSDLDFRNLMVEVVRHEELPQQFHTMQFGFCPVSAAVSAPLSPVRSVQVPECIDRFVSGAGAGIGRLPRFGVFALGNDGMIAGMTIAL